MQKTKMTVQQSDEAGFWFVTMDVEWPDGRFLSFGTRHKVGALSVSELERSAMAKMRDALGDILGIPGRTP